MHNDVIRSSEAVVSDVVVGLLTWWLHGSYDAVATNVLGVAEKLTMLPASPLHPLC